VAYFFGPPCITNPLIFIYVLQTVTSPMF